MKMKLCTGLLCGWLSLLLSSAGYAQVPADLRNLAWLHGHWQSQTEAGQVDETWSLQGNSLLGVSRGLKQGLSTHIELLLLEPDSTGYQMRLRFFSAAAELALRGKDQPLRLQLVSADQQHLLCQGIGPEAGTSLSYRLLQADKMEAELIKRRDGVVVHREYYQFTRLKLP